MSARGYRAWWAGGAAAVVMVAAQLVSYGRSHDNPPVTAEPVWDAPATRALAKRACFDCHSNETEWPPYASIAPISWLVQHDVDEGRSLLNFSEWDRPQEDAHEAAEVVAGSDMPPLPYTLMHGSARLTSAEREQLARGLALTICPTCGPHAGR